ncbi:MAG TPA: molybdopterin molybdenumtransferase MoeA, partial [Polyangiaceae bacterium]|nr:molybdopterin molybdenumtransferase MoeA [Polyangiaceae bacterium]
GPEIVPLAEAWGRVATEDVTAGVAVPHFVRSMMDGYAVVAESTFSASEYRPAALEVVGEAFAGHPATIDRPLRSGEAVRITTGAPLPDGADAVLVVEHTVAEGDRRVLATQPVSPQKHVAPVGEDISVGDIVLRAGRRLRPQDVGVLASVGVTTVAVIRRPRVRILITGDELLPPGSVPEGPRIVDSNSLVLGGLARRDGAAVVDTQRLPDDPDAIGAALSDGGADLVLLSGGSSVGPEDHAPRLLAELGELVVHGVAMRPSSPAGFGTVEGRPVFLLPGNPVSCLCAYEFFAGPALRVQGGGRPDWPHRVVRRPAASKLVSVLGRTDFMRVRLHEGEVVPIMTSGASVLSSTTEADGAVIIDDGSEGHAPGDLVDVHLFA